MDRIKYLAKILTRIQKETYAQIIEDKTYVAKGNFKNTCKALMKVGLITTNPKSSNVNEYVIKGEPLNLPFTKKLPLPKDILKDLEIAPAFTFKEVEPEPEPTPTQNKSIVWAQPATPPTVYSNTSREQHVEKWIGTEMPKDIILPVKSLTGDQMDFIVDNYSMLEAQEMADQLTVDVIYVRIFCQLNGFEVYKKRKKLAPWYQSAKY